MLPLIKGRCYTMRTNHSTHGERWFASEAVHSVMEGWQRLVQRAYGGSETDPEHAVLQPESSARDVPTQRSLRLSGRRALHFAALVGVILLGLIWATYTIGYYDLSVPPDQPIFSR